MAQFRTNVVLVHNAQNQFPTYYFYLQIEYHYLEIQIQLKEKNVYEDLKNEFIDKFWNRDVSFEQSASENDPHSSIL